MMQAHLLPSCNIYATVTKGSFLLSLLEGRLVRLRPLRRDDLTLVGMWDQDEEVTRYSGRKFALETPEDWLRRYIRSNRTRAVAIETLDGRLIGDLELEEINWRAGSTELRITLGDKEYWNRGFGTDAVNQALHLAFVGLSLHMVYLRVYASNRRAIRCYEKCNFRREGVLRAGSRRVGTEDILLMSVARDVFVRCGRRALGAGATPVA